jgi:DtxR family Mn-dependent transcriptional regulator
MKKNFHTVRGYQLLEQKKKTLTPAMEDYLEMIYRASLKDGYIRITTLSALLNVRAPSATKMVQKLTGLGLLHYKKYGIIFLTESGKEIGQFLLERHNTVEKFLKFLGVGENLLVETELIEHNISLHTLQLLGSFNQFLAENPYIREQFEHFKKTQTKKETNEPRRPEVTQRGKQLSSPDGVTS